MATENQIPGEQQAEFARLHKEYLTAFAGKSLAYSEVSPGASPERKWLLDYTEEKYSPQINLLEIPKNLIVLEYDENTKEKEEADRRHSTKEQRLAWIEEVKKKLEKEGIAYNLFDHQGKCPHIHIALNAVASPEHKKAIAFYYAPKESRDFMDISLLVSKRKLFPVPFAPHWKYGTIKKLIKKFEGNKVDINEPKYKVKIEVQNEVDNKNTLSSKIAKKIKITDIASEFGIIKGANGLFLCPFHDDKNPSLSLSDEKGLAHCFGCEFSSNLIGFFMKLSKHQSKKATRILMKRAGIECKNEDTEKLERAIKGLEKLTEDELCEAVAGYLSEKPKQTKKAYYLVAKYFLSQYHMIAFVTNGDIHMYKDGIYVSGGKELIEKEIEKVLTNQLSNNFVNEVLGHIRRTTFIGKENALEPVWKICLENNILDLKDLVVLPHSPEFYFFSKMPVKYNPDADCLLFKEFLKQILREQKDVDTIQELFGYCLLKDYPIQKLIILLGEGANGKSTLLNVLRKFLGIHNCSAVPLQQLTADKFAGANLFSKMANICSDMSAQELKDITIFKLATGEDTMSAEKKFKDKFSFRNYAKMIFAANRLPLSAEESDAFFRRLLIIRFLFQFLGKRADKNLTAKLTTDGELSGILNFAIAGLKRLLEKGEFSSSVSLQETKTDYIRTASPAAAFVMDELVSDSNSYIQKADLYSKFVNYCMRNKLPTLTAISFNRELQKRINVIEFKPLLESDGEKIRPNCWKGIKYRNSADNTDNTDRNRVQGSNNSLLANTPGNSGDNTTLTDFEREN